MTFSSRLSCGRFFGHTITISRERSFHVHREHSHRRRFSVLDLFAHVLDKADERWPARRVVDHQHEHAAFVLLIRLVNRLLDGRDLARRERLAQVDDPALGAAIIEARFTGDELFVFRVGDFDRLGE